MHVIALQETGKQVQTCTGSNARWTPHVCWRHSASARNYHITIVFSLPLQSKPCYGFL